MKTPLKINNNLYQITTGSDLPVGETLVEDQVRPVVNILLQAVVRVHYAHVRFQNQRPRGVRRVHCRRAMSTEFRLNAFLNYTIIKIVITGENEIKLAQKPTAVTGTKIRNKKLKKAITDHPFMTTIPTDTRVPKDVNNPIVVLLPRRRCSQ